METKDKRNIIGVVLCFISCTFFGCLAIAFWMIREVIQSDKYGFDVEKDDIVRYSYAGAIGYIANILLIKFVL